MPGFTMLQGMIMYTSVWIDGVLGCELGNGEESNFHITEVSLKVKLPGMEAGWVVKVCDIAGEGTGQ